MIGVLATTTRSLPRKVIRIGATGLRSHHATQVSEIDNFFHDWLYTKVSFKRFFLYRLCNVKSRTDFPFVPPKLIVID